MARVKELVCLRLRLCLCPCVQVRMHELQKRDETKQAERILSGGFQAPSRMRFADWKPLGVRISRKEMPLQVCGSIALSEPRCQKK